MTTTALATLDARAPMKTETNVAQLLTQYKKKFDVVAPKHLDVSRMLRVALMTVSRSRDLLECTGASLLGAFMMASQLGLDIAARECHLVPFKNKKTGLREVQLVPDYRGIMKLVRNSGQVINMRARLVYNGEFCEVDEGLNPNLRHIPDWTVDHSDANIIGAYCVADFCDEQRRPTGFKDFQFLPVEYFRRIKANSPAGSSGPWVDHFGEMCMKTVIKHHAKSLPYSVELEQAITLDNRQQMGVSQQIALTEGGAEAAGAELGPDDEPSAAEKATLPQKPAGTKGKLDDLVDANKKKDPPTEQQGGEGAVCNVEDFMDIETLARDGGVAMKSVYEHVTETMGFKEYAALTKARSEELVAWIRAKAKK